MSDFNPSESAETLFGYIDAASEAPGETVAGVGTVLLTHLLEGTPVEPETLSRETGLSSEKLDPLLADIEAERNGDGQIVGVGLSLRPTPHQYEAQGKVFYAWCAADTLLFPALLNHTATVTSRDPTNGDAIKVNVSPDAIEDIEPTSAVMTWAEGSDPSSLRETFCLPTRYFADENAAYKWAAQRDEVRVLSVEEAHDAARPLADRVMNEGFSC